MGQLWLRSPWPQLATHGLDCPWAPIVVPFGLAGALFWAKLGTFAAQIGDILGGELLQKFPGSRLTILGPKIGSNSSYLIPILAQCCEERLLESADSRNFLAVRSSMDSALLSFLPAVDPSLTAETG